MKISVIIPTYKPDYYIWECLNSLRNQTLKNIEYEVLIILNGEKEPFFSDIRNYIKLNKVANFYLIYTTVKGVSNARNLGIDISKGKYICFIDDDDYVDDNYLEELLTIIEKRGNKGIVVTNYLNFEEQTKKIIYKSDYSNIIYTKSLIKARKIFSMACIKLIPKNIIGSIRFKNFLNGEDALFMLELSKNIKYISLVENDTFYHRRVRKESANFKDKKIGYIFRNTLLLIYEYMKFLIKKDYNKKFILIRIMAIIKGALMQLKLYKGR